MANQDQQIKEILERGVENIYPNKSVLEKVLKSGKKLKIYNGIDPTGQLHIGHGVVLNKLRQFQDLGHEIIVLIGDFTAMIGDPTDKLATRKPLTRQQVLANAKGYKTLIGKILDLKKTKFMFNSSWLAKLNFSDLLELASEFTVQRLLERDMFAKRLQEGKVIHLHEFMYPVMQGYDCVAMDVDMEIGGSDQTYNMLAGRTLMKKLKNKEKFVLTTKLLEDTAGIKMGKTQGNMVSLSDDPQEIYGKVMSWTDGMIMPAFEIATDIPFDQLPKFQADLKAGRNPKELKMILARQLVARYYGVKAADEAQRQFEQVFAKKTNPDDITEFKVKSKNLIDILLETKLADSKSEARRLLSQGGIKVDGQKVSDENFLVAKGVVIQKGKRHFARIV